MLFQETVLSPIPLPSFLRFFLSSFVRIFFFEFLVIMDASFVLFRFSFSFSFLRNERENIVNIGEERICLNSYDLILNGGGKRDL